MFAKVRSAIVSFDFINLVDLEAATIVLPGAIITLAVMSAGLLAGLARTRRASKPFTSTFEKA